jgi:hypothetical protein
VSARRRFPDGRPRDPPSKAAAIQEGVLIFKVELDGESISCSSPRCVQRLLHLGWRLSDASQTGDLLLALEAEEHADDEPAPGLHPRGQAEPAAPGPYEGRR